MVDITKQWTLVETTTDEGFPYETHRLKVPNGWLYRFGTSFMCFVPDKPVTGA